MLQGPGPHQAPDPEKAALENLSADKWQTWRESAGQGPPRSLQRFRHHRALAMAISDTDPEPQGLGQRRTL